MEPNRTKEDDATSTASSDSVGLKKRVGLVGGMSLIVGSIVGQYTSVRCNVFAFTNVSRFRDLHFTEGCVEWLR
jgi:hypothetical protein